MGGEGREEGEKGGTEGGEWEGKKGRERREVCVIQSQKEHIHVYIPTGVYLTCGLSSSGATYIAVPTRPVSPAHHNMSNGHVISCDGHVMDT